AERRDVHRRAQPLDVAVGQVEQRVHVGDAERVRADPGPHDLVAGPYLPFDDHAQVEAGTVVGDEQRRHARLAEPHADAEAGDPRLGDLELGVADAVAVADADLVVAEPLDGEVLAELAELEVVPVEVLLPVPVRLDLVDEHRALLAAVPVEVALAVAVDVQPAHHPRPVDLLLPDPGVHGVALPADVLRQADVDRQQPRHRTAPLPARSRVSLARDSPGGTRSPQRGGPAILTSMEQARRLVLIRHAKAAEGNVDRERPLAKRGMNEAPEIGRWLAERQLVPDRVVVSPALRARQTWERATTGLDGAVDAVQDERVYDNSREALLAVVRDTP